MERRQLPDQHHPVPVHEGPKTDRGGGGRGQARLSLVHKLYMTHGGESHRWDINELIRSKHQCDCAPLSSFPAESTTFAAKTIIYNKLYSDILENILQSFQLQQRLLSNLASGQQGGQKIGGGGKTETERKCQKRSISPMPLQLKLKLKEKGSQEKIRRSLCGKGICQEVHHH